MIEFDYLWEYFDEYKYTTNSQRKREVVEKYLSMVYSGEALLSSESQNIVFGNLYEDLFNISHEDKLKLIKCCVYDMFEKYLTEEDYEKKSLERGQKRLLCIRSDSLYDEDVLNERIDKYFKRYVYFTLKSYVHRVNNPKYFLCQECGMFFHKTGKRNQDKQKYCERCKVIVARRQKLRHKLDKGRKLKNATSKE